MTTGLTGAVMAALAGVRDPELDESLVELGFLDSVRIEDGIRRMTGPEPEDELPRVLPVLGLALVPVLAAAPASQELRMYLTMALTGTYTQVYA